jgi:hypothetical protein
MHRHFPHALVLTLAALAAGCTHVAETRSLKSAVAPQSLSAIAVEYLTPRFDSQNLAAQAALVEWRQITAVSRDVTPRVFARAHVTAVVVDENPALPPDPAAAPCKYLLVITLGKATASSNKGYHNETAHIVLVDRRTRAALWNGDTYMAGGATGFEAADVDKFLVSVIAALHKDGIVDETAAN